MERPVCLVNSKDGQCVLLAGHTGYPHRSSSGHEWEDSTTQVIKRGPGRPKKVLV